MRATITWRPGWALLSAEQGFDPAQTQTAEGVEYMEQELRCPSLLEVIRVVGLRRLVLD